MQARLSQLITIFEGEVRRRAASWWSYRFNAIGTYITYTVAFLLVTVVFRGLAIAQGAEYGTREMMASLLGVLFWNACAQTYASIPTIVEYEASLGTLENVMLAPVPLRTIVLLRSIAVALELALESLLMGIVLSTIMRLPWAFSVETLLAFVLTAIGAIGVGMALAGLSLIYKRISEVAQLIANLSLFVSGALVPIDSLTGLFQFLKVAFPVTWGISLARQTVESGSMNNILPLEFAGLTVQTILFISVGLYCFQIGLKKAIEIGNLTSY